MLAGRQPVYLQWLRATHARGLALILLLNLAVDAIWVWANPPDLESGETGNWWPIVTNLIHGQGYSICIPRYFPFCGPTNQVTASREPLPIFLFAIVAKLTNESLFAAALVEIAIDLAIGLGVFFLARRLAGERTGLLAALCWALYLPVAQLLPQVSGGLPAALCVTYGALFFVRARRTDRARDWLAAGMCIGLGALSRSVVVTMAPALAIVLLLWPLPLAHTVRRSSVRRLRSVVLLTTMCAATLTPWIVRNYVVFGHLVVGSTLTGYNLYRYNHILTSDNHLRFVGEAQDAELLARRRDLTGTENEAEMDAVYREEALRVITAEPLRYIELSLYRFLMLWFNWGVNRGYGEEDSALDHLIVLEQGLLLVTATGGALALRRRAWPLLMSVAAVSLAYMAVACKLRFIVPVMPLVVTLSAAGFEQLVRQLCRQAN